MSKCKNTNGFLFFLQVIAEKTDGGVDYSVECTGNINAMIQAFECVHDVYTPPIYYENAPFFH